MTSRSLASRATTPSRHLSGVHQHGLSEKRDEDLISCSFLIKHTEGHLSRVESGIVGGSALTSATPSSCSGSISSTKYSKMGSGQSVQAENAMEQRVIDQLRAMRMEDKLRQQEVEKEYIHIDNEKVLPRTYSSDPTVSLSQAEEWEKTLLAVPKNKLALSALLTNDVDAIVSQKVDTFVDTQTFNVKIPFEGAPITNQRSSGRCW